MTLHDLTPTGSLRAAINLGNPVLTHGTAAAPGGVTVAIAGEVARRLGVPLELVCVDAARKSFASLVEGSVDVSFLAIEPAREADVAFSPPYLAIEGVYVVPVDAPFGDASEVDRPGVTIGVKEGSAYDLYLTRTLEHAGRKSAAASSLNISRQVLYDRIAKIERLLGSSLDDAELRTSLHVALLADDVRRSS